MVWSRRPPTQPYSVKTIILSHGNVNLSPPRLLIDTDVKPVVKQSQEGAVLISFLRRQGKGEPIRWTRGAERWQLCVWLSFIWPCWWIHVWQEEGYILSASSVVLHFAHTNSLTHFDLKNIFIGQSKLPDSHQLHHNNHFGSLAVYTIVEEIWT